jgi:hypothetical protein
MNQDHSFYRCTEEVLIGNLKTLHGMYMNGLKEQADSDGILLDFEHLIEKLKSRIERTSDRCTAIDCVRKAKYTNLSSNKDYCEYHI